MLHKITHVLSVATFTPQGSLTSLITDWLRQRDKSHADPLEALVWFHSGSEAGARLHWPPCGHPLWASRRCAPPRCWAPEPDPEVRHPWRRAPPPAAPRAADCTAAGRRYRLSAHTSPVPPCTAGAARPACRQQAQAPGAYSRAQRAHRPSSRRAPLHALRHGGQS